MNSSLLKKSLPHFVAILVFLIIAVLYCRPAFEGKVLSQSDVINWKGMAQQSFEYKHKYGHFPLWTESAFSGMPAYTIAMEATSKISLSYIYYLLTLGLPKPVYFFFLACVCFYILTQVLAINSWVGIMGSLAYAYSTFDPVIVAVGHDTQMYAIGYAPAILASSLLVFQKKWLRGTTLLAIFFGLQVSTQHLQIVYYTVIITCFMIIGYLVQSCKNREYKDFAFGLAMIFIGSALGFGSYAISWMPLQEYAKETKRGGKSDLQTASNDENKSTGGLDKDYAFNWSYGLGETFTLIVPNIYGGGSEGNLFPDETRFSAKMAELGTSEDASLQNENQMAYWGNQPNTAGPVYLGAVICFLALFAAVYLMSRHKWWLISISILGIILAWGKNFPAFNYFLFDHFPFYSKFRAPTQALFLPQFAFPVLASMGLNALINDREDKAIAWSKFRLSLYITASILVILTGLYFSSDFKSPNDERIKKGLAGQIVQRLARGKQPTPEMQQQALQVAGESTHALQNDRQSLFGGDLFRSIFLIAAAALLTGLYLKGKIKSMILVGGLVLTSSYDLLAEGRKYFNEDNFLEPLEFEASFNPTPADQLISKDPEKGFRVFDESQGGNAFQDAQTSYHHNSIGGYSPAKLGLYQDIIDSQLSKMNKSVFNMLNTKYFIRRNPMNGQPMAMSNSNAYGPCWLVKGIRWVDNGNEELRALDNTDLRDTAIIENKFQPQIPFPPVPDSGATIRLVENRNDIIDYKVSAKTNQFAVFSEVYYDKGWEAWLDGKEVPYCKVNYILRGMPVATGDHSIEFRFDPPIFRLGNWISVWCSLIAYLLLIASGIFTWRNYRQQKEISNG